MFLGLPVSPYPPSEITVAQICLYVLEDDVVPIFSISDLIGKHAVWIYGPFGEESRLA